VMTHLAVMTSVSHSSSVMYKQTVGKKFLK
jgi:hypothetical protein